MELNNQPENKMANVAPQRGGGRLTYLTCLILVLLVLVAQVFFPPHKKEMSQNTPPAPGSQQSVDTGLSLSPSTTSTSTAGSGSPHVTPPTPPPVTYVGCKLSLGFGITGGSLASAGTMHYTLAAKNLGSSACQSASISVYYPDNETFVSSVPNATADGYYWQLGDLAPGRETDIALITSRSLATSGDQTVNQACLSADNGADACSNAGASATGAASVNTPATTPAVTGPLLTSLTPASGKELGVWVWTPLDQMTQSDMQTVVNEAAVNHFNAIYITIDAYLSTAAAGATNSQTDYINAVQNFLALASAKNIAVDAEAGWRDWGEPANRQKALTIMNFVAQYNGSHSIKFRGVQYDVEPYLLAQYNNDQAGVLTDYAGLVEQLVNQDKSLGIPLSMVIPHFFDDGVQWTPQITLDGVTTYTYNHLLRLLNQLPNARVIVMAYRDTAAGADGAVALANTEVHEADDTNVKVIVAQETGSVTPGYVTFYGSTRADLAGQAGIISQTFASDRSFGGIAIDYLDPFLNLP